MQSGMLNVADYSPTLHTCNVAIFVNVKCYLDTTVVRDNIL